MENDSHKGKEPPLILGVASPDASGLRRSARESTLKKNVTPSPSTSGTRKSERLEKPALASPPAQRKSERLEKQNQPLRRSPRGSSGPKKSDNSSGTSSVTKKLKKEKSMEQLAIETKEVSKSEKKDLKALAVKEIKWNARSYRKLFSQQTMKDNVAGHSKEQNQRDNIFVEYDSNLGVQAQTKIVDGVNQCNSRHVEEMREETSEPCHKRQRISHDAQQRSFCFCNAKQDSCDSCMAKDGIVEYWVPAKLSSMQLEQYCAILLSNSLSLCSSSKNDAVGALQDILISTRKCCDHPYLMDPSLQASLIKEGKAADILDVGINASGKLQLLDAMLSVIRKRGSKVLILFQSSGGSGNIGDILDDFVRQRYGEDAYERIDGIVVPAKKQAAVNNFNNNKGIFVFLLETRSCSSIIKLSPVDMVIIFGSDWCPLNDLRNLQKIRLDSQSEQIKVFRLYSSYTVEEKALILGKRDKALDSKLQNTNPSTCHMLLMWGASHLFEKLAKFHSGNVVAPNTEQSFLKEVIREFLAAISKDCTNSSGNLSLIWRVKQNQEDDVANFPLFGERKITLTDEEPPHVFWEKLLGGKEPQWKYLSVSSQRNRKRTQRYDNLSKETEVEDDGIAKKQKKVPANTVSWPSLETVTGEEGTPAHLVTIDSNHASMSSFLAEKDLLEVPEADMDKLDEGLYFWKSQKSLHLLLKPKIAKLCEILRLPEDVKTTAESFLEYVMNNHHVTREPASTLEAFQISLCWIAASLLKYKLNHKESVALAKQHLNFGCRKAEADQIYSMLRCLKNIYLDRTANRKMACFPEASQKFTKDSIQDHLNASKSVPCDLQNVGVETKALKPSQENDQVLSQLGVARNDVLKSIKDIEKKCQKEMAKLLLKQKEEKENLFRKYEEDKALLNSKYKTEAAVIRLCSNNSMRADKLKSLDTEYERKFEELKHQKEMVLKDLEATHVAERNKLQDRKTEWFEMVISWARVELINKTISNGNKHSQVEASSLNSFSKEHILEGDQCMADGEAAPEIPEALSSNGDEEDLPPSTSEQISYGAQSSIVKSSLAGEKTPSGIPKMIYSRNASEGLALNTQRLGVPETVCSNEGLENLNDKPSSEEQSLDRASFPMPNEELTTEVPETVSSNGGLDNVVPINHLSGEESSDGAASCMHDDDVGLRLSKPALNRTLDEGNAVGFQQGRLAHGIAQDTLSADDITGVHQQRREAASGVPETASGDAVEVGKTVMQQDGKYITSKTNQESHSSNQSKETNQHGRQFSLGIPEIDSGGAEEAAVTSNKPDGKMQADNSMGNQDFQCWDKTSVDNQDGVLKLGEPETAGLHQQRREAPSGVPETASGDAGKVGETGVQQDGKYMASKTILVSHPSNKTEETNQRDGHVSLGIPEIDSGGVEEAAVTSNKPDGKMRADNSTGNRDFQSWDKTSVDTQDGVLQLGEPETAGVHQQRREVPSGVPETALGDAGEVGETGVQKDGKYIASKTNQESHPSNKTKETNQHGGHISLGIPEIDPGGAEEAAVTGNELGGKRQADNSTSNQGFQSWDKTSVDEQDNVLLLGEPESASAEQMEGGGIDRDVVDVANLNNNVASDRSHGEEQIIDVQPQSSLPLESPSSLEVNLPSASGIEHQQTCEDQISTDTVHCQTQFLDNNVELSTQAVYQSEMHSSAGGLSGQAVLQSGTPSSESLPIEFPLGGSGLHISDARSMPSISGIINHPVQAGNPMRVPPSLCHDPLQNELERIERETDQIISIHGNQKLQLKSDCEKEIAEIHRKYDAKIQEVETEFLSKKKDLEASHKKVIMSRILAEAFRSKCTDVRTSSIRTIQQDLAPSFMQQLLQLSSQAPAQRPATVFSNAGSLASLQASAPAPLIANLHSSTPQGVNHFPARSCLGLSSAGYATSLQTTAPTLPVASPHGLAPSAIHRPPAQNPTAVLSSAVPAASLQTEANCPPAAPPAANLHGSTPQALHHSSALLSRNSARPPHICSISPSAINRQVGSEIRAPAPHLQRFRPSLSMSLPSTSAVVTQLPAQTQPSYQQSILHKDVHCSESAATLPPHSNPSLSAVQLLIEVDNQAIRNTVPNYSLPLQTDKGPNVDSSVPPELGTVPNPACPNDILCLSDDECCTELLY